MIEEIIRKRMFEFDDRKVEIGVKKCGFFGNVLYEKIDYYDIKNKGKNVNRWRTSEDVIQDFNNLDDYYNNMFDEYYHGK